MALTKSDRTKLIEEMKDTFVTKEELAMALADLVQQLPSKEEINGQLSEILGAINKREEGDAAHKLLHHDLGEDVPKIKRQVKHLATSLNVTFPVDLAF